MAQAPFCLATPAQPQGFTPSVFQRSVPQQFTAQTQVFSQCFPHHGQTAPAQSQAFAPSSVLPFGQTAPAQSRAFTPVVFPACATAPQAAAQISLARPRPAMPPKLAAALSPVLSLNCREGHGLVCISGKPASYPDWGCDLCGQRIPHDTQFVMHCDKCSIEGHVAVGGANGFDVCPACRAKARDAMSVWPLITNAAGCPMFPGVGEYWQTLYCHRKAAPSKPMPGGCAWIGSTSLAPCGPRQGQQCLDCQRGQDALIASVEGKLLNRSGRAMKHVCYGANAGKYFCSECSAGQVPCDGCKFTQENLPGNS